ncbi:Dihydroorotate dehydrogenase 2, partial [Pseudomonas coronafaciens pv. coronafaciens]
MQKKGVVLPDASARGGSDAVVHAPLRRWNECRLPFKARHMPSSADRKFNVRSPELPAHVYNRHPEFSCSRAYPAMYNLARQLLFKLSPETSH